LMNSGGGRFCDKPRHNAERYRRSDDRKVHKKTRPSEGTRLRLCNCNRWLWGLHQ
jgi:hypothetical protein